MSDTDHDHDHDHGNGSRWPAQWILGLLAALIVGGLGASFRTIVQNHDSLIWIEHKLPSLEKDVATAVKDAETAVLVKAQHGEEINGIRKDIAAVRSEHSASIKLLSEQISLSTDDRLRGAEFREHKDAVNARIEVLELKLQAILDKLGEM